MTRQEFRESLYDTKVYVNGKSNEIQQALKKIGFTVKYIDSTYPFLYMYHNCEVSYGANMTTFNKHAFREVSVDYILNTEYDHWKPFENADQCFAEMYKHQPFGWIKKGSCNYQIISCNSEGFNIIDMNKNTWTIKYSETQNFKFIDGSPFALPYK